MARTIMSASLNSSRGTVQTTLLSASHILMRDVVLCRAGMS
jgi:hypothetical protein